MCGAEKSKGGICELAAGYGTDHPGQGRCKHHGGLAPSHTNAVAPLRRQVATLAEPIVVTPAQGLAGALHLAAGNLEFVSQKVAALPEDELMKETVFGTQPNAWIRLQHELMDRVAKYAKMGADVGLAERAQDLQEAQTRLVADLMEKVFNEVGLTAEQRRAAGPAIRRHLVLVSEQQPDARQEAA